jgi:hypothetical protein
MSCSTINRLALLVVEAAIAHLPHRPKEITLVSGKQHVGSELAVEVSCGL